jgi:6-phosphogluconolactonase
VSGPHRELEILPDAVAVAARGARVVVERARRAIETAGSFSLAVSGGRTPWAMFEGLAGEELAWERVGIWQVDERVAPEGDPDRNLTSLAPLVPPGAELHPMPVTELDLDGAAARYAASLPRVFDLVHLGLGEDGHTASLVPGDSVLDSRDRDVALTDEYRGRRRMTLTYPVLERSRQVLWLVTGADKAPILPLLLASDPSIPAGRVAAAEQLVVADAAAAAEVGS